VYAAGGRRVVELALPLQYQGESITVAADGRSVLVGSEGPASEVWRVPLPESALPPAPPTTGPAPVTADPPAAGGPSWWPPAAWLAGIAVVLGPGLLVLRARRRR
jgi:hypothetical protein